MNYRTALRSSVREINAPVALAVDPTVALAELGLGVSEIGRVTRLIVEATFLAEAYTNRVFITRTLQLTLDQFPTGRIPWWDGVVQASVRAFAGDGIITVPKPPLVTVNSVQFFSLANVLQTVDANLYYVDASSEPARIVLNYGQLWPTDTRDRAAVVVLYNAGYGPTAASMPGAVGAGIMAHVRSVVERPNASVNAESIDNASVTYGAASVSAHGGLRADAAQILATLRILDSGV